MFVGGIGTSRLPQCPTGKSKSRSCFASMPGGPKPPGNLTRVEFNLLNDLKLIWGVQPPGEKYSAYGVGQISDLTPRVSR
jgi:hypothetical protein